MNEQSSSVEHLVSAWLSLGEVASELGVSQNKVRQMVRERELLALRPAGSREPQVPADFVRHGAVLKGLPGTLTVLADAGYDDEASVRWLFSEDESLPGTPLEALRENRGKQVRRRAQALAF